MEFYHYNNYTMLPVEEMAEEVRRYFDEKYCRCLARHIPLPRRDCTNLRCYIYTDKYANQSQCRHRIGKNSCLDSSPWHPHCHSRPEERFRCRKARGSRCGVRQASLSLIEWNQILLLYYLVLVL